MMHTNNYSCIILKMVHNKVDDGYVRREGSITLQYCHCLLSRQRLMESWEALYAYNYMEELWKTSHMDDRMVLWQDGKLSTYTPNSTDVTTLPYYARKQIKDNRIKLMAGKTIMYLQLWPNGTYFGWFGSLTPYVDLWEGTKKPMWPYYKLW